MKPYVYAVIHKDEEVRMKSRSGGIFTAISDYVFDNEGIVYGCILDDKFDALHIRASSFDDRNRMRGSKYIQSRMGTVFKQIKNDMENGKLVLFSGTSCQVAGLRNYIGNNDDNLICVDIVCHGVPSNLVWQKYLEWISSKTGKKITDVTFRDKNKFGWRSHFETIYFEDNSTKSLDLFKELFYGHCILRPSCYTCPFKSINHPGDITIADYWGIEHNAPEFDDNKGVSLVLVNSQKGKELFTNVKDVINWKETNIKNSMQQPLIAPFPKPKYRDAFWRDLRTRDFEYILKKYTSYGILKKIRKKVGNIKRKILRKVIGRK